MIAEIAMFLAMITLLYIIYLYRKELNELKFQKYSLSSKYGKMSEQFMPFLEHYPFDRQNFRFIGTPIDGIQFEDDRVVFVEFKTGSSTLTAKQRLVRELIKDRKVEFREFRI